MIKLFYSPPKWFAFITPARCEDNCENLLTCRSILPIFRCSEYEKAYAEAKANALEVGNPRDFQDEDFKTSMLLVDGKPFLADGQEYDWKGSAVIKDGKYILSV